MSYQMRNQFQRGAAVVVLLLAGALVGCGDEATESESATPAPVAVEIAVAENQPAPILTQASGSVEPIRRVLPGTKILGRIEEVAVREGDRVGKSELLARIESRDLEAAVNQVQAGVRMAEANLENARIHHARMVDLHGRGSVTDKNLEDVTAAFRVAEAGLDQAKANLTAAEVTLSYAEIRSPIAGWVVAKNVEAGDMASPGAPLFTIEDVSQVKVDVRVPEAEMEGLAEGGNARVELLGRQIEAPIDRIVPAGDPASRTFLVRMVLDNPDGSIKSGMFARVSFARGERQMLRVEADAVVTRGQLTGIFVVGDEGKARLRWIKIGRADTDADGVERVE
ncbi:MAG: efflux RND transporter periplasmic adaptor subunit, partial [bacterium]|nr:efflux RND transporter periplasmic adaptor subunit [bacterium]